MQNYETEDESTQDLYAPLDVYFRNTSYSTEAMTYFWDFGDGNTSIEEHPMHTYTAEGLYTVKLTASNATESKTKTEEDIILVQDVPVAPAALFSADKTTGEYPLTVTFTNDSTGGSIGLVEWDFGDGTFSTEYDPVHVYQSDGVYDVKLKVANVEGEDILQKNAYIEVAVPTDMIFRGAIEYYGPTNTRNDYADTSLITAITWTDPGEYVLDIAAGTDLDKLLLFVENEYSADSGNRYRAYVTSYDTVNNKVYIKSTSDADGLILTNKTIDIKIFY